ncbi:MAG: EamA family transporter [Proteobacteria bacterium]|nr:EamA family transporter [Pseudomonadota bacterium]
MSTVHSRAPSPLIVNSALALLCGIWGSTWLVIREGLEDLPPMSSAGSRFAVAALLFFVLVPLMRKYEGGIAPPRWMWLINGVISFAVPYGLVYYCEQTLPSGLVSLLWAVFPMMQAMAGHFFLPGEQLGGRKWLGFLIGFIGVAALFHTDLADLGTSALATGALLLCSPLSSCLGTTLIKRYGAGINSLVLNRNSMSVAAVLLLVAAGLSEYSADMQWTARAIASIGYLALFGTVITFGLYFWLLRFAHAHYLSLISYITPALALFLGWFFADEPISRYTFLGGGLIFAGILLIVAPRGAIRQFTS